jgi:hypothetical protein
VNAPYSHLFPNEAIRLETYGNQTSNKNKTTIVRKYKNWKEVAKERLG